MKEYTFQVEGIDITVLPTSHASLRMRERNINGYQISGALMMLGEEILDMKSGHEFIIVDEDLDASYVFGLNTDKNGEIYIDVITVVDTKDIWNKKGMQILRLK